MNRSTRARSEIRPDRRKLSDVARHVVLPEGIVTTGWPKVEAQAKLCGIEYDGWQRLLGRCILGKTSDGVYAAGIGGVVISICRQVGKTFLIGTMIVMLCILNDYPLKVLWTAHRTRTSDETFKFMCALVQQKAISRFVDGEPRRANGQQEIVFINGSRVMFGARENGFGRGFDSVDVEVFDEAQILTERALDDMIPATNAARNPLIIYMGTPPKPSDPSEVFSTRRSEALKGDSADMLYVEFSADRDADGDDRRQWAVANPSYPHRTGEAAILRMKKNLGEDSFRREGLGIWDETTVSTAIDPQLWANGAVPVRADGGVTSFGIDMSPDRNALAIGACMKYPDRSAHIELAEYRDTKRYGTAWAADWIAERWPRTAAVVIDAQSPAMVLLPDLKSRGVRVMVNTTNGMGQACGRVLDMLTAGTLHHLPDEDQPQLAVAVANVTTRPIGKSGAFGWNKTGSDIDISPLVACTMALQGAWMTRRNPNRRQHVMH
ncbi:terminase [Bifidobacterium oedipodis]|uniref:Terminase n=1 Tax=Bifidobacterium oedipodis TaxID=2675322 RepID=A0A7Y0ENG7_9BIFI|nr:terminase [Bifidobacterium sp. DSM 109957]NMM93477.1 terminase [Bifidobacterium sp. DSM 109957]